jgi:hypothetical protein
LKWIITRTQPTLTFNAARAVRLHCKRLLFTGMKPAHFANLISLNAVAATLVKPTIILRSVISGHKKTPLCAGLKSGDRFARERRTAPHEPKIRYDVFVGSLIKL